MTAGRVPGYGRVDRSRPVAFRWEGRPLNGLQGDTLASALLANDVGVVGRSFKYHRPRGITSAGVEESGALVTVGRGAARDPNVRATQQLLYEGLDARGQNAWPNVRFDVGEVNSLLARFFAAGFYYKTFMGWAPTQRLGGTAYWMFCERFIRRAAGLGRASREPDPDRYERVHEHVDVLVVGSGPTGLVAAVEAAEAGLEVLLVEQEARFGGHWLKSPDDGECERWLARLHAAGGRSLNHTTAFGLYDHGVVGLIERVTDHLAAPPVGVPRQRLRIVRTGHIVLASGALERGFAFADNDRPGVMTVDAARTYLHRFGVRCGREILVSTNNDSAYDTAAALAGAGARVTVLDARRDVDESLRERLDAAGVAWQGSRAVAATRGRTRLFGAEVATFGNAWRAAGRFSCDSVLVAGGWNPLVHLVSHLGERPVWDAQRLCFRPRRQLPHVTIGGSAAAHWRHDDCLESGRWAAARARDHLRSTDTYRPAKEPPGAGVPGAPRVSGPADVALPSPAAASEPTTTHDDGRATGFPADASASASGSRDGTAPIALYEVRTNAASTKAFVDLQHDVTTDDVRLAHHEGFVSVEHMKRYTTLGMATDQGKVGNVIGIALMAAALDRPIDAVGTTTFRPPYTPVAIGALRGQHVDRQFRPVRRTPLHDWQIAQGAVMTEAGLWERPWYFPEPGEDVNTAGVREARAVRESVGLCDVTSLGKIAVQGPDAGEFLERVYRNRVGNLAVGRVRYGVMLRDDGMVFDDGTVWRLDEDDWFVTTTTAQAAAVLEWLEQLLQTRWPDLRVRVVSVTDCWAAIAIAGPGSRDTLAAALAEPSVVSSDALPFMHAVETALVDGTIARVARISFSGERAFELYVPPSRAVDTMERLWNHAHDAGGCLYGLEALGVLRIEKGFVTHAELDGRVTLADAGLAGLAADKPAIGAVLARRDELLRPDRPTLVGIRPVDRRARFSAGAILCRRESVAGHGEGWITAVADSPALGHRIGLGFIAGGVDPWASTDLVAADPVRGEVTAVEIVPPVMFDAEGARVRG